MFCSTHQPGCGVDHPAVTNAEVQTGWSYTFTPPMCLLGSCTVTCNENLKSVIIICRFFKSETEKTYVKIEINIFY
jgi:hypothetical protein